MTAGLNETTKTTGGGAINDYPVNIGAPLECPMGPDHRKLLAGKLLGRRR